MPTISGLRRRGYTRRLFAIFVIASGSQEQQLVEVALLEHCIREDLNARAPRRMAVLEPLRVVLENYPRGLTEEMEMETTRRTRLWVSGRYRFHGYCTLKGKISVRSPKKFFRLAQDVSAADERVHHKV